MNKSNRKNGFSQILILIIISFLAIALPITTKLVQKNQENRSSAKEDQCSGSETTCSGGYIYKCSNHTFVKTTAKCGTTPNPGTKACTSYTTGSWSACVNGKQTRSVTPKPEGCSGGGLTPPAASQSCTIPKTCTSFTPGEWGACNKFADGYFQVRTVTGSPAGCTGGNPPSGKQACVGGDCGTGLYTCNNGVVASKEDPVGSTFKWKCGTISCSMPFSSCAGGDRPLGCNCAVNSDCSSNTCYKSACVSQGCKHAGELIPNGRSMCFDALGGLWSEMITCNSGKESVEPYIGSGCVTKAGPEDCVNGRYKCNGTTPGSHQSLVCKNNKWELNQACGNSGCNSSTGLCNGDNTSPVCGTSSSTTQPSGSSACSVGTASGFQTTSKGWSWNCVSGNKTISCSATKSTACSSSSCSSCGTNLACTDAGCSWGYFNSSYMHCETKTDNICTPNTETKCSSDSKSLMTCNSDGTGWNTATCPSGKCENKACTSSSPGPGPGPGDYSVCTANTVSTTECYDSTHLKKCDSTGLAWIQGDQCSTGQVCANGVCGIGTTGNLKLSFRISFDGVGSTNLTCSDNFKTVKLIVGKVGTTLTEEKTINITRVTGVGSENSKKFAIFEAKDIALGVGFSGATNVYAKIKGQVHARMYYCTKGQSVKSNSQICNLSLDGTVNNFYEYPILGGDVDQDGVVTTSDFTMIKNDLNKVGCGYKTDLNGDKEINQFDYKIYKVALEAKYDE